MGVRGLTNYIAEREANFMEDIKLPYNSTLVIDGDALATNIYIQMSNENACFGGDYEMYAASVEVFLNLLLECKIIPYILFDGGVERRKMDTIVYRLRKRLGKTLRLNGLNKQEDTIFPLFLVEVCKNVIRKMNIKLIMCDSKCHWEVANIAKQLDSPVLSYNSDYFIFDVKYIPFYIDSNRQIWNVSTYYKLETNKETNEKQLNTFFRCKIFNRSKFLLYLGLTQDILPMLSAYLGNDFIQRLNVQNLCNYLNILYNGRTFVENIVNWFQRKTVSETIEALLNFHLKPERKKINDLITETIDWYQCKPSQYISYFDDHYEHNVFQIINDDCKMVPLDFLKLYRNCFYHRHLLNFLIYNKYCPPPLVEEIDKCHSYKSSFPIISALHKILTNNSEENLIFYGRSITEICEEIVPKCNKDLPNFQQLQKMNLDERSQLFLIILNIKPDFMIIAQNFPKSWQIFLITLKYMSIMTPMSWAFINSLMLSKIVISHIDKKIGLIRTLSDFNKYISRRSDPVETVKSDTLITVQEVMQNINARDSEIVIEKLLPYFQISGNMKNDETLFDRKLVHCMSEFQSCLLNVEMLNDVFNRPYQKICISEFFNGTFIYNIFSELSEKSVSFIRLLLESSSTVWNCFNFIIRLLENHIDAS